MEEKPTLREFLYSLGQKWGATMSGGLSVPLALLGIFWTQYDLRPLWITLSIICIWYAAYATWAAERKRVIQAERKANSLVIHWAVWGAEGGIAVVTDQVLAHVSADGKLEMPCGITVLGDPRPYLVKTLTIDYSVNGVRAKRSFREHEIARLP